MVEAAKGSKKLLLDYFLAHVGEVLKSSDLHRESGGASEFGRRIRELRADGWAIETHNDDEALRPGDYILKSATKGTPISYGGPISGRVRSEVLKRAHGVCEWCGAIAGEPHPVNGRRTIIVVAHRSDRTTGVASKDPNDFFALCSVDNDAIGDKGMGEASPYSKILSTVRRMSFDDKKKLYEHLAKTHGKKSGNGQPQSPN